MYTTCTICQGIFLGKSNAYTVTNAPLCGACFNDLAYGEKRDIPVITEVKPGDFGTFRSIGGKFDPPPTMG